MLSYPVQVTHTANNQVHLVVMDVPEAAAEGLTEKDAMANIKCSLELALSQRLRDNRPIPVPSRVPGAPLVTTRKFILQPPPNVPISGGRI